MPWNCLQFMAKNYTWFNLNEINFKSTNFSAKRKTLLLTFTFPEKCMHLIYSYRSECYFLSFPFLLKKYTTHSDTSENSYFLYHI